MGEQHSSVTMLGTGEQVYVMPLTVTCAQKAHHRSPHQLTRIPKPFSRIRLSCGAMNQAEEIEIIRHGCQLAADSAQGEEESAIEHGPENAIEAPRRYIDFLANGNNPLSFVSQPRGALHFLPAPSIMRVSRRDPFKPRARGVAGWAGIELC